MFRKIVTELAYSPSLAGNLGYYVKQLRDETSRRQIGLICIALAVTVQLFAALSPPESANANNPDIFIDGGIRSISQYLDYYDKNTGNSKDLLTSLGVTRSEIAAAKLAKVSSLTTAFTWSKQDTRQNGSNVYFFTASTTQPEAVYYRPASPSAGHLMAYIGSSAGLGGKFAITQNGASLITEKAPNSACANWLAAPDTPLEINSWFGSGDPSCSSLIEASVSARKISTETPEATVFNPSDRIAYTLSITNKSDKAITFAPSINLEDAIEYSRVLDYGGGEYNLDTSSLSWPTATLKAHGSTTRTFITQLLPTIPATARGAYIDTSYDCTVTLSFGTTLSNPVSCPLTKHIEQLTNSLPPLPARFNAFAPVCLAIIALFFYLRSRQMLTELYIIRHNHLDGL